jgi:transcriptional regulator with GAF, ATPase, and Fis domain
MREVVDNIKTVAPTNTTVMIRGENGTGKELVAKAIHFASPLRDKPFIKVNCAAIPDDLIESELFGHVKGAFTGAMGARKGKFELANGGTIFLDEIGDMKLEMQSKLLRVLQEGEFEPVGGEQTIKVNVRVLSATNRNLEKMISEEQFRQDLYYRLAVIPIQVPPLRDRLEDIAELVTHFSRKICNENNRSLVSFSEEALSKLKTHQWPGNVRELKNIIERLIILSKTSEISRKEITMVLPSMMAMPAAEVALHGKPLKELVADFEKKAIEKALDRNDSHVSNTARELGLERSHLYKKMKAYGVNPR